MSKGWVQRRRPTSGSHRADPVHQPQADDAAGHAQRDGRHDQQRVAPVGEDGDQQQVDDHHGDEVVAAQGLAGRIQLVAGAGDIHADAGRHRAAGAQVIDHLFANDLHRRSPARRPPAE